MASKGKLYIVTMYRWGNRENHSYVIGAFTKKQKALDEGEREAQYRGGKYDPEVLEVDPNQSMAGGCISFKTVKELRPHPDLGGRKI
jgi:hypothetical protein